MYLTWSAEEIINDPGLRARFEVALLDVPPEVAKEVDRLLAIERGDAEPDDTEPTAPRRWSLARALARQKEGHRWP